MALKLALRDTSADPFPAFGSPAVPLDVPYRFHRNYSRSAAQAGRRASESAEYSLRYLLDHLGWPDFADTEILDVGCGTKLTSALLDRPVGRYVGVDVHDEMVTWLRDNVRDPRFEHHRVNFHNARYNPWGERLTGDSRLPVDGRFDLIVLLSVFTHLEPHDYRPLLSMLRRYAKPSARLFYTLFLDERSDGGQGAIDAYAERFGEGAVGTTEGFQDFVADDSLAIALYSREYAVALIEGTGWEVVGIDPPNAYMQHQITCRPV